MSVSFDTESLKLLSLLESLTGVELKDCIIDKGDNRVYVVVEEGKSGLVVGKDGTRVRELERLIGKPIRVFEYSPDPMEFVKKLMPIISVRKVEGERLVIEAKVPRNMKGLVLGRNKRNLKLYQLLVRRCYDACLMVR
jgi:N utilization substance protein A